MLGSNALDSAPSDCLRFGDHLRASQGAGYGHTWQGEAGELQPSHTSVLSCPGSGTGPGGGGGLCFGPDPQRCSCHTKPGSLYSGGPPGKPLAIRGPKAARPRWPQEADTAQEPPKAAGAENWEQGGAALQGCCDPTSDPMGRIGPPRVRRGPAESREPSPGLLKGQSAQQEPPESSAASPAGSSQGEVYAAVSSAGCFPSAVLPPRRQLDLCTAVPSTKASHHA